MEINHEVEGGILVIHLKGEVLDAAQSRDFRQAVLDRIDQTEITRVVLDLQPLRFIDSSGLGALLSILRYTNTHDGDVRLASMASPVKKMFQVVRMHRLFEIFADVPSAVASFSSEVAG
ncbi:MAG: STAS domain-containing protein [Parachlamydiales bacterium]